jgi:hypothetical protein
VEALAARDLSVSQYLEKQYEQCEIEKISN